jgi:formiminoglutamase
VKLPLLVSLPHAGLRVPEEVAESCILTSREILEDGDVGAAAIYGLLEHHVSAFVRTDIARAIVDLNRAEDDRRKDGVVKTHTCWDVPVYREKPPEGLVVRLLERYYRPYHRELTRHAGSGVILGVDCHTMAATAPPVAPDVGRQRPAVCLGDGDGTTCSPTWTALLAECLEDSFELPVRTNDPFRGGHLVRAHHHEIPWIQLELSRAPFFDDAEKGRRVLAALEAWCRRASVS